MKYNIAGAVQEHEELTVTGETLDECRRHFNDIWPKKEESK